jgi:hypothetical protein
MGRIYYVSWDAATSISAAIDIFEFAPADDKPIYIHELHIWQEGTSDVGDTQEEILGLSWRRKYTTSGSGGGTAVAIPAEPGDSAAGFSLECRNTTVANTGTPDVVFMDGFNVRIPYIWTPGERFRPYCSQAQTQFTWRMTAPADAITLNAMAVVEEMG